MTKCGDSLCGNCPHIVEGDSIEMENGESFQIQVKMTCITNKLNVVRTKDAPSRALLPAPVLIILYLYYLKVTLLAILSFILPFPYLHFAKKWPFSMISIRV